MSDEFLINKTIFDDEITLWWRKETFSGADGYRLYLNGVLHGETDKTHYSFSGLEASGCYSVGLEALKCGEVLETAQYHISTPKRKRRLNVKAAVPRGF